MKAIGVKEAGGPEKLEVIELPEPSPQEYEILIEQDYAGINYGDVIRRKRGLFSLNECGYYIPGFEGVGRVISVGDKVKEFKVGDKVSYLNELGGGYSQKVCVNEKNAYKVSEKISEKLSAVISCVGITAWNLVRLANISRNEWVLIYGAAGGVGNLLLQLCVNQGVNVIAVVGTRDKGKFVEEFMPTGIVVRENENVERKIKEITEGVRINTIFDCVGQKVREINFNCIENGGTIIYYGSTSGHSCFEGMNVLMNSLKIQGFNIFNIAGENSLWKTGIRETLDLFEKNKLKINIDGICNINEVSQAHRLIEEQKAKGKYIIDLKEGI